MNRNEPATNFSSVPVAEISRSTFDRSSKYTTTFNVGSIIPFYVEEVLPGDTFSIDTAKVVRLQTPAVPFMDNLYLDTYYFFVPNRLVWNHWINFMGENTESAWIPETQYFVPQLKAGAQGFQEGSVADYMGVPTKVANLSVNALPFRAYALICDQWFRDENLQDPLDIPLSDAAVNYKPFSTSVPHVAADYVSGPAYGGLPYKASKLHDYFTSALPTPQKGPDVTIPLFGSVLPVITQDTKFNVSGSPPLHFNSPEMTTSSKKFINAVFGTDSVGSAPNHGFTLLGQNAEASDIPYLEVIPDNLVVDATAGTMASINALRLAFQTQKYYEKLARGGSRYIESIKSMFNVTNPDYRLQRSEYLGGNRLPFNVQQVVQTSASEAEQVTPIGYTGAQSLTTDVHSDFTKSFTEHGFIIGVCVARYHHSYQQGLNRIWSRSSTLDYYFPVFANIGEQPIYNKEIYATGSDTDDEVFGYQEAWSEYRYKPSVVTAEMRSNAQATLDYWHFADKYSALPRLSPDWIVEDEKNVDRALRVQSSVANQIFVDFYIKCKATRPMPIFSVPGLIDHH